MLVAASVVGRAAEKVGKGTAAPEQKAQKAAVEEALAWTAGMARAQVAGETLAAMTAATTAVAPLAEPTTAATSVGARSVVMRPTEAATRAGAQAAKAERVVYPTAVEGKAQGSVGVGSLAAEARVTTETTAAGALVERMAVEAAAAATSVVRRATAGDSRAAEAAMATEVVMVASE